MLIATGENAKLLLHGQVLVDPLLGTCETSVKSTFWEVAARLLIFTWKYSHITRKVNCGSESASAAPWITPNRRKSRD
jgi:hypothetical protein